MKTVKSRWRSFGWAMALAISAQADGTKFDFKDPKGVNSISFTLDAPLEAIRGSANGISGEVVFDPDKPETLKGKILVTTASMHVPNPTMKEHMHGKDWMDVASHADLTFEVESLSNVQKTGDVYAAKAQGKLTMKGVTRSVSVPVKVTYLKDKLGARTNGRLQGDLLVVRAQFTVKRSEFGINPGAPTDKVSDEVELTLSLAGSAPKH